MLFLMVFVFSFILGGGERRVDFWGRTDRKKVINNK